MSQLAPKTQPVTVTEHEWSAIGTKACRCCSSGFPLLLIDVPMIDFHATNAVQVTAWPLIYSIATRHTIISSLCCMTASELVCQLKKLSWVGGGWCKNVGLSDQIGGLPFSFLPISFLHHNQPLNAWKPEFSVFSVWCVSFTMKINLFGTGRSQCLCIVQMPLDWTVKHDVLFPTTRKETALQQEVFWYVLCPNNKDRTCNGNQDLYSRCRQTCFITRGYHSAIAQCLCFIRESWRWRMTFVATRRLKQQPMSVTCKVFTSKVSKLVLAAFPFFCHAQTVASHSVKMLAYVAPSSWTFSLRGLLCGEQFEGV